jgi:hypothetical protein
MGATPDSLIIIVTTSLWSLVVNLIVFEFVMEFFSGYICVYWESGLCKRKPVSPLQIWLVSHHTNNIEYGAIICMSCRSIDGGKKQLFTHKKGINSSVQKPILSMTDVDVCSAFWSSHHTYVCLCLVSTWTYDCLGSPDANCFYFTP